MSVEIVKLSRSDRQAWGQLWEGYLAYYETTLDAEMYDLAFERMLSEAEGAYHGRLAKKDGKAIGLVHFLFHPHGWKREKVVYLQDLFVDPDVRGTGAGHALIEAVYKEADAAGCPSVYWLTQDFNQTARRLYDDIGELTPFIKYQRPA